jgi:hypothetical protein
MSVSSFEAIYIKGLEPLQPCSSQILPRDGQHMCFEHDLQLVGLPY